MNKIKIHVSGQTVSIGICRPDTIKEIASWVADNDIGRRTSYLTWNLASPEAVTLFILKWGSNEVLESK